MKTLLSALLGAGVAMTQTPPRNISFVSCPIVRDTRTTPCWLAEYKGELYFLGTQGGVAQDFYPPQLNHEVLVEGVIAEGPRVCGGIPLQPVKTSVLLELNRACNTILPMEDGVDAPRRAPGPGQASSWTRSERPGETTIFFDFDNDFLSLHSTGALQKIAAEFQRANARELHITANRGSSRLSNGTVMTEKTAIAAERAGKVREILVGLGISPAAITVEVVSAERTPDGATDAWSRKVTLSVKP